jgi:hypothetical protein
MISPFKFITHNGAAQRVAKQAVPSENLFGDFPSKGKSTDRFAIRLQPLVMWLSLP